MNEPNQTQEPEQKPDLRVCRCGVALVTKRALKTGLCVVCTEKLLHATLERVPVPAGLAWKN
jgi:hypothetical protein